MMPIEDNQYSNSTNLYNSIQSFSIKKSIEYVQKTPLKTFNNYITIKVFVDFIQMRSEKEKSLVKDLKNFGTCSYFKALN